MVPIGLGKSIEKHDLVPKSQIYIHRSDRLNENNHLVAHVKGIYQAASEQSVL